MAKGKSNKKSIETDKVHLRWLDTYLSGYQLHEISNEILERVAFQKESEGVTPTTVNRVLEIVRALLTKAHKEWEWIEKVPAVRMRLVENSRIRWLTIDEANRLLKELPSPPKGHGSFYFSNRFASIKR